MLTKSSDNEAAFLASSSILQQPVHDPLFSFSASLSLAGGDLDKRLVYCFYGERLRLSQREALLLLGFEGYVSRIAIFVVQNLQRSIVQATDLSQGLGYS